MKCEICRVCETILTIQNWNESQRGRKKSFIWNCWKDQSKEIKKNQRKSSHYDRLYAREHRKLLRIKILELLGNKCSNPDCAIPGGMDDLRCLQIDHVNGGGNREKVGKLHDGYKYYKMILKKITEGSKDYQLLCANCNWIKRCKNHEFPKNKEDN